MINFIKWLFYNPNKPRPLALGFYRVPDGVPRFTYRDAHMNIQVIRITRDNGIMPPTSRWLVSRCGDYHVLHERIWTQADLIKILVEMKQPPAIALLRRERISRALLPPAP